MGRVKIAEGSQWRQRSSGTLFRVRVVRLTDKLEMIHCDGPKRMWNGNRKRFLETFERVKNA